MTHWKKNFDYKFTGAYELQPDEEKLVTIIKTGKEEVTSEQGKKEICFVAYFQNEPKPMILNKTNCKTLAKLYTPMIENWNGKQIYLISQKVKAFGEVVDALRIKMIIPKPTNKLDTTEAEKILNGCETLQDLQAAYTNLTKAEQLATVNLKNELKTKLN